MEGGRAVRFWGLTAPPSSTVCVCWFQGLCLLLCFGVVSCAIYLGLFISSSLVNELEASSNFPFNRKILLRRGVLSRSYFIIAFILIFYCESCKFYLQRNAIVIRRHLVCTSEGGVAILVNL